MKRFISEPLIHFLLIGAALFATFSFLSGRDEPAENRIIVSAGKIEHLAALFARTWQRPPTRDELESIINDYIREEAAYREGIVLGLDRDDTIVRRRIRQKLEFVAEDLAVLAEPDDEKLAEYLAAHPDDFRVDPRLSFRHVYLDPDQRSEGLFDEARDLLIALNGDASLDAGTLGDRILLEHGYADVSAREIASLFGEIFATAVAELEPGAWYGPIPSGYGEHLVRIDTRVEGRLPDLVEVRDQVRREWANSRRLEAIDAFYGNLLERYDIDIEWTHRDVRAADE